MVALGVIGVALAIGLIEWLGDWPDALRAGHAERGPAPALSLGPDGRPRDCRSAVAMCAPARSIGLTRTRTLCAMHG